MGVEYTLINLTKREQISFIHMAGSKMRELAGNPAQAAVVTWYMLHNQGDEIQFVSDSYGEWPFRRGQRGDELQFRDVTLRYIGQLLEQGILKNQGFLYIDPDDPTDSYILNLKNIYLDHCPE